MVNRTRDEDRTESHFRFFLWLIVLFLIILMFFLSGSLKWLLGLTVIFFMGLIIIFVIYEKSKDISFWQRDNELDTIVNLNLERLSEIAGRAYRNRNISKALFEERVREEFIKKLKNHKNISNSKMESILNDPEELRELIGDDLITEFLVKSKSYSETLQEQSNTKKSFLSKIGFGKISINEDYKDRMDELLKRMEEWN